MHPYSVYILYSKAADRFYIGQTEDLDARLLMHREKTFTNAFTKIADDWEVYWHLECESRETALKIESYIKQMRNRKYYYALKTYPDATRKLIERFK